MNLLPAAGRTKEAKNLRWRRSEGSPGIWFRCQADWSE